MSKSTFLLNTTQTSTSVSSSTQASSHEPTRSTVKNTKSRKMEATTTETSTEATSSGTVSVEPPVPEEGAEVEATAVEATIEATSTIEDVSEVTVQPIIPEHAPVIDDFHSDLPHDDASSADEVTTEDEQTQREKAIDGTVLKQSLDAKLLEFRSEGERLTERVVAYVTKHKLDMTATVAAKKKTMTRFGQVYVAIRDAIQKEIAEAGADHQHLDAEYTKIVNDLKDELIRTLNKEADAASSEK